MGIVKGTWLLPSHSGRACHHESIYTKMNKKTGKCYSVKLCNPNTDWSADQVALRNKFGLINQALTVRLYIAVYCKLAYKAPKVRNINHDIRQR